MTATTTPRNVRRARRALAAAEQTHRAAEDRIRGGDTTVTATDLADAANGVRFAQLQLESAERVAAEDAAAEAAPKLAAYERRARQNAARNRQAQLESQLRAIRSGGAARSAQALGDGGSSARFPTTEAEFMAAHPTFVEGATYHHPQAEEASP